MFSDSIRLRGIMTSSTVMFSRSNRFSRIDRCFCGMNGPVSSTIVRNSSADIFIADASPGRTPNDLISSLAIRLMSHTAGEVARMRGRRT